MITQIVSGLDSALFKNESGVFFKNHPVNIEQSGNAALKALVSAARQVGFSHELIDVSLGKKHFIKDAVTAHEYSFSCLMSVMSDGSYNFLICEIDNLVVLIAQHVSSADFIYIPSLNFIARLCHINDELAAAALNRFKDVLPLLRYEGKHSFDGIIASHGRPAHFFYDTILGVQALVDNFKYDNPINVYQLTGSDFLDLSEVYGEKFFNVSKKINFKLLNDFVFKEKRFVVKVGGFYGFGDEKKIKALERFDSLFLHAAELRSFSAAEKIKTLKNAGYFIVWHGITTDKRKWIEQESAVVELVKELTAIKQKICLIVDGWTSPCSPTSGDEKQIANDLVIFESIATQLQDVAGCQCISIIGQQPIAKTQIASLIDVHISNGGTGSLYTSRIARKKGLLHIANRSRKMTEQSIHYNSYFLPNHLVNDIKPIGLDRDDYVSYSISVSDFCQVAKDFILNDAFFCSLAVLNVSNCERISGDYNYKSYSIDPIVLFDSKAVVGLTEKLNFVFELTSDIPLASATPKLYLDFGKGFSESTVISGSYDTEGRVVFEKNNNVPLVGIRFDPFESVGSFSLISSKFFIVN